MQGWKVRTIADIRVLEHRRTGTARLGPIASRVEEGIRLHSLGYSPLFTCLRTAYRVADRPWLFGSLAMLYGCLKAALHRYPHVLRPDVVRYLRSEQQARLRRSLRSLLPH